MSISCLVCTAPASRLGLLLYVCRAAVYHHPAPDQPHNRLMTKEYKALPSADRLWELFDLNPLTGKLFWRVRVSARCRMDKPAGCKARNGYTVVRVDGVLYGVHRIIRAWVDGDTNIQAGIDHWDRNPQNNTPWNLRLCTQSQNMANVPRKGWTKTAGGKYAAAIKFQGQNISLGQFVTPLEASAAYITAKRLLFGGFACVDLTSYNKQY